VNVDANAETPESVNKTDPEASAESTSEPFDADAIASANVSKHSMPVVINSPSFCCPTVVTTQWVSTAADDRSASSASPDGARSPAAKDTIVARMVKVSI
jgi:hypothetical protein